MPQYLPFRNDTCNYLLIRPWTADCYCLSQAVDPVLHSTYPIPISPIWLPQLPQDSNGGLCQKPYCSQSKQYLLLSSCPAISPQKTTRLVRHDLPPWILTSRKVSSIVFSGWGEAHHSVVPCTPIPCLSEGRHNICLLCSFLENLIWLPQIFKDDREWYSTDISQLLQPPWILILSDTLVVYIMFC